MLLCTIARLGPHTELEKKGSREENAQEIGARTRGKIGQLLGQAETKAARQIIACSVLAAMCQSVCFSSISRESNGLGEYGEREIVREREGHISCDVDLRGANVLNNLCKTNGQGH